MTARISIALALFALASCADTTAQSERPRAAAASTAAPTANEPPPVSRERAKFYQQAFPSAAQFVARGIPVEMIRSANEGNDTYVVARDRAGKTLGYLRDFSGPVSFSPDDCPCNPINLTLVFNADYSFRTLIAPAPPQKLNHDLMSEAEQNQLIAFIKNPPEALSKVRRPDQVIDVTTGATKKEYVGSVVKDAGLSTQRLIGLAKDTARVLQGAPLTMDKRRLDATLAGAGKTASARAAALAKFLPTVEATDVGLYAYQLMVIAYLDHLKASGNKNDAVETRFLAPGVDEAGHHIIESCYRLAGSGKRLPLVEKCIAWARANAPAGHEAEVARLVGTFGYLSGDMNTATEQLSAAGSKFSVLKDPHMHLRLAKSLIATGDREQSCELSKAIFAEHPMLPGAKSALKVCTADGNVGPLVQQIYSHAKNKLVGSRRANGAAAPTLPVEDTGMKQVDLTLGEKGKVTVAVFFATWCPHCRAEFPRIVSFTRTVESKSKYKGRVRVIGIRTAIEKETEPYQAFEKEFKPNFDVLVDPVMALAFSKFSKALGRSPLLPTVAVIDEAGVVRFILEAGDYRDTGRELMWAVDDIMQNPGAGAAAAAN